MDPDLKTTTVKLAVDEIIIGVVAKLHLDFQSVYTDFQFQIAKLA
jgi:hypothetical protein